MQAPRIEGSKKYRVIGVVLSAVWAILIAAYLIAKSINPLDLPPNEFGDFLAGVLGPLGILWIVLGFWQQGDELRSSVEALNLQSEELRNSVEQQKALVEVTRNQAEAEIEALAEERRARRIANAPNLHLHNAGGSSSGKVVNSKVSIWNTGTDCTDVDIYILNDSEEEHIASFPVMSYKDKQTIMVSHERDQYLNFSIVVRYRTRDGMLEQISFKAWRAGPQAMGFRILRSEDIE